MIPPGNIKILWQTDRQTDKANSISLRLGQRIIKKIKKSALKTRTQHNHSLLQNVTAPEFSLIPLIVSIWLTLKLLHCLSSIFNSKSTLLLFYCFFNLNTVILIHSTILIVSTYVFLTFVIFTYNSDKQGIHFLKNKKHQHILMVIFVVSLILAADIFTFNIY